MNRHFYHQPIILISAALLASCALQPETLQPLPPTAPANLKVQTWLQSSSDNQTHALFAKNLMTNPVVIHPQFYQCYNVVPACDLVKPERHLQAGETAMLATFTNHYSSDGWNIYYSSEWAEEKAR